jgi:cbb3-type cytochrome oxidase subunit 3
MIKLSPPEVTSVAGGVASIGASLTLTQIGVAVGIATAILTFVANVVYMYRKDRREQRESDAAMAQLEVGK